MIYDAAKTIDQTPLLAGNQFAEQRTVLAEREARLADYVLKHARDKIYLDMDRIKKTFNRIHAVSWLACFLLFCWVFSDEGNDNPLVIAITVTLSSVAVFYGHFFALTRFQKTKQRSSYLLSFAGIIFFGPLPFLSVQKGAMISWSDFADHYFTTLIVIVPFFILLSWIARATENSFIKTLKTAILEKQAVQSELAYLKSQINPHFLFNTLNNIHSLVYKKSGSAPDAVMKLSSLMRYMLYESNVPTVSLQREIDYLLDYVSLQQLRYKNSPIVDLEISGDLESCRIAPLLFIHLIENAYKHSRTKLEAGDIKVRVRIDGNSLNFSIENPLGDQSLRKVDEPGGFGLANVRKRLQLIYPGHHRLEAEVIADSFHVNLTIDRLEAQAHEG